MGSSQSPLDGTSPLPAGPAGEGAGRSSAARRLRVMFEATGIVRTIGAHDALGARLGERAGFDAIWSSGLEISASHGVPDADLLTMSELLEVARWMAGAVTCPVVADCDTGYGNATNVAHMVRRYEAAGIAAVCIEDKRFPKMNSFIPTRQRLVPVGEFAGKLAAAKNAQRDPDFVVIARIEALVAGMTVDDALHRAHAYEDAGADAVLVHAKDASPAPVLEFLARWSGRLPVVVVPTTYFQITASELEAAGAKMVIYANQGLRAGVRAVTDTFQEILRSDGTATVESRIASLKTIFELQGVPELMAHDATYLRGEEPRSRAMVVAPSERQRGLRDNQSLSLRQGGIDKVTMAGGADVAALLAAVADDEVTLIVDGDLLLDSRLISRLLHIDHHIVVAVRCRQPDDVGSPGKGAVRVRPAQVDPSEHPFDPAATERVATFLAHTDSEPPDADADMIGLLRLSAQGARWVRDAAQRLPALPTARRDLPAALALVLAQGHPIHYMDCPGGWAVVAPDETHDAAHVLAGR